MIRLKLSDQCEAVYVFSSLVNPLTGQTCTIDAKIDTGATVYLFPLSSVSDMGLEIIGETELLMANGSSLRAYIAMAVVCLSEEDAFEVPIYICKSEREIALIGMDILSQCNYSQWHEWKNNEHSLNFMLEVAQEQGSIEKTI